MERIFTTKLDFITDILIHGIHSFITFLSTLPVPQN